jgi:hypothetical protein
MPLNKKKSTLVTNEEKINKQMNQLSLYLRRENNKQIFTVYELILRSERGITYDSLSKKIKTDIINISHYCCKLKKMRLIDWEHKREGIVVSPKTEKSE